MSKLDDLVASLDTNFKLNADASNSADIDQADIDILFNLPLIALIVLLVASRPKNELQVDDVAHWVSRSMMELYANFVFSLQRLRFSSAIRKKSVEAIVFLESLEMIEVSNGKQHAVKVSAKGREFLGEFRNGGGEFSVLIGRIQSAIGRIESKGWSLL